MGVSAFDVSVSGLRAQRLRMEIIANNLANLETTSSKTIVENAGGKSYIRHIPYRRKNVVFMRGDPQKREDMFSVSVSRIIEDKSDFRKEFDPSHPHSVKNPEADDFGYVYYPNINPFVSMTDMMTAVRAYEANAAALDSLKSMGETSLRLLS